MKLNGNGQKKSNKKSAAKQGGRAALIAAAAVAAVIMAGAAVGVSTVSKVDTIFPNVTVDGLEIGGLTLAETAEKLSANGYGDLSDKRVSVALPTDYTLTVSAEEVCTETPVSDIALMAWDACKGGSAIGNAITYLRCKLGGMELESGAAMNVDAAAVQGAVENAAGEVRRALLGNDLVVGEDAIRVVKGAQSVALDTKEITDMIVTAFQEENYTTLNYAAEIEPSTELDLNGVYDAVHVEKQDAYYDGEMKEVVPETVGVSFDVDGARKLWSSAAYGEEVRIPLVLDPPEVTAASLEALLFRDRLSAKTTSLAGSSGNRINNVTKAAESINGLILMPGEEFSYNPALGERTKENGYLMAGAYSGGQTVQEYGGGICQVSSTLYYCTLYANLQITARTCHMFPVGYLPPGLDATVSWGGPEFKFVNDREYPIRIDASVDEGGKNVTVELWGTDTDGSYVEMTSDTWYVYDTTYTDVRTGYKAQTFRSVFDRDGKLLSRKTEATSTYNYHQEDIAWPEETPGPGQEENSGEAAAPIESEAPPQGTETPPEETETPPPKETGTAPEQSEEPAGYEPEQQEPPAGVETPVEQFPAELPPALENIPAVEPGGGAGDFYDSPQLPDAAGI